MADKNKNGVDDSRERLATRKGASTTRPKPKVQGNRIQQSLGLAGQIAVDPIRQGYNFVGDIIDAFSGRPQAGFGEGQGDELFGKMPIRVQPDAVKKGFPWKLGRRGMAGPEEGPGGGEDAKSLADYLAQAASMIGGGGGGGVNYDPQRATLRGNAAENDARLEAMYRQLRGSIDADAPVIQKGYQEAIDATAQNNSTAQAQAQAATNAANAQNNEVLANLGIQEAQGNAIIEGRDLNTQTAHNIGDMAARGQAAGDRLVSNQASALSHNTNIGNAAGLEGNLQRAANQSRLQALLAEIDMQEQQQNASRQDNSFAQQLGLAGELVGYDRYNQERQDNLQMQAAELAAQQGSQYDPNAFWNYVAQLQNVNGLNPLSEDPNEQVRQLDLYRKIFQG